LGRVVSVGLGVIDVVVVTLNVRDLDDEIDSLLLREGERDPLREEDAGSDADAPIDADKEEVAPFDGVSELDLEFDVD
jgi:hypothetical protein